MIEKMVKMLQVPIKKGDKFRSSQHPDAAVWTAEGDEENGIVLAFYIGVFGQKARTEFVRSKWPNLFITKFASRG